MKQRDKEEDKYGTGGTNGKHYKGQERRDKKKKIDVHEDLKKRTGTMKTKGRTDERKKRQRRG